MDLTARESNHPHHATKSQESDTDTETPLQNHLSKALSLTNGSLTRHRTPSQPLAVVSYRECLKNHAASLGGVILDGCGEFMPTPSATLLDPSSLKCAACGCHRNFHRRDNHHHHHQPTPPVLHWTPSPSPSSGPSPSPSSPASPTPQQSFYPAAPHMLLALGHTGGVFDETRHQNQMVMSQHGRKRARTKFTEEQRQKMQSFAEKLGWKMLRGNDEKMVQDFCSEVGVKRNVFKVWMHNNKHRRDKAHDGDISVNKNKVININGDDEGFNKTNDLDKYQIEKRVDIHGGSATDDGSSPD